MGDRLYLLGTGRLHGSRIVDYREAGLEAASTSTWGVPLEESRTWLIGFDLASQEGWIVTGSIEMSGVPKESDMPDNDSLQTDLNPPWWSLILLAAIVVAVGVWSVL